MDVAPIPAELGPEPPIADELDEAILVGTIADPAAAPARVVAWYPTTDAEAEWCLRKYAAVEARQAAVREQHAAWREPIDAWRDAELARLAPALAFFSSRLQTYALARRAEDPKHAKTTRLPSGSVATRGSDEPKVVVADEAAVLAWAAASLTGDEYDAVVKTTEAVLINGLRAVVTVREVEPLLPPAEWEKITGHRVVDPDGWRGKNDLSYEEPITLVDFQFRASLSTSHQEEPSAPMPPPSYVVVQAATGEVVPGCAVEVPEVTATVKVDR